MKKGLFRFVACSFLLAGTLSSCGGGTSNNENLIDGVELSTTKPNYQVQDHTSNYIDDQYKNYYQILLYSYFDSNNDKIGDFNGLTSKLDYINDGNKISEKSLGYDGIYLLPIFPSPTYHKYDATDYYSIDPTYGTMEDFENFMRECKSRGIDVILDLALNHTSNQHPWFQQGYNTLIDFPAVEGNFDPETGNPSQRLYDLCPELRYYHFIENSFKHKYPGARFHNVKGTNWVYEGSFYDGMPDLNLDDPQMVTEIKKIMKFWLDKGVAGFRLDAVKHFFDWDKKKSYALLNQIADFGKDLTKDRAKPCYLVAEGPWGSGILDFYKNTHDISYMNFFWATNGEDKLYNTIRGVGSTNQALAKLKELNVDPIYENPSEGDYDITNFEASAESGVTYFTSMLKHWTDKLNEANPNAIDANFGVNHDTVRMSNRMAPWFDSEHRMDGLKVYWGLNNTLSGVTYNYYGEEIGMRTGDQSNNKDPNKRHPMYWSTTNTQGMCRYAEGAKEVEQYFDPADKQMEDKESLWNFMRELNRMKTYFPEIARGKQSIIKVAPSYFVCQKTYNGNTINLVYSFSDKASSIPLNQLGLEEEAAEIKYSLSSSQSYFSKLIKGNLNVPGYSITII